jgi:hypothetical protein
MSLFIRPRLESLRSFALINVSNKDCAASVIHKDFDLIPDMGWSIDSSIFVMRHAPFDATDLLKHIGPTLHRRHLTCKRKDMRWYWEPHIAGLLGS